MAQKDKCGFLERPADAFYFISFSFHVFQGKVPRGSRIVSFIQIRGELYLGWYNCGAFWAGGWAVVMMPILLWL